MPETKPTDNEAAARAAVLVDESRAQIWHSAIAMLIMTSVVVFLRLTFHALVDWPWLLDLWIAAMVAVIASWVAGVVSVLRYGLGNPDALEHWRPRGRWMSFAMTGLIALSPWLLLPNADPALRALMIMMYVWYMATLVMASSTAVPASVAELAGLTISVIGFVLWSGMDYVAEWTIFVTMAGVTMIAFRHLIRRGLVAAIEARVASEFAEVATREALALAAAERDAKTRFIAAASHDLQQPLQAASLFFEYAVETGDAAARERAIAGARSAFVSTQALIGEMLDHLRLEAGAVTAKFDTVELGPLIAAVASEHEPGARAAGMRLIVLPCRLMVIADAGLLRRAVGNLIANAVRHAQGERVLIGARRRGGTVTLWVIDDGRGIEASDAVRLFEDYARGSDNAARGGFGLGLASVRRSLRLMDGEARLDPRWAGGAAFALTLTAATTEALCVAA